MRLAFWKGKGSDELHAQSRECAVQAMAARRSGEALPATEHEVRCAAVREGQDPDAAVEAWKAERERLGRVEANRLAQSQVAHDQALAAEHEAAPSRTAVLRAALHAKIDRQEAAAATAAALKAEIAGDVAELDQLDTRYAYTPIMRKRGATLPVGWPLPDEGLERRLSALLGRIVSWTRPPVPATRPAVTLTPAGVRIASDLSPVEEREVGKLGLDHKAWNQRQVVAPGLPGREPSA